MERTNNNNTSSLKRRLLGFGLGAGMILTGAAIAHNEAPAQRPAGAVDSDPNMDNGATTTPENTTLPTLDKPSTTTIPEEETTTSTIPETTTIPEEETTTSTTAPEVTTTTSTIPGTPSTVVTPGVPGEQPQPPEEAVPHTT